MRTVLISFLLATCVPAVDEPDRAGRVVLVAGGGEGVDGGRADRSKLSSPFGVGFDGEGTMYFVEMTGHLVRKVGSDGMISTVAGTGKKGDSGDGGPAKEAEFNGMHSLAVARDGTIYVADTWNNRVRKIDARSGKISTIAGTGKAGFSGDGGPANEAKFGGVYCLDLDEANQSLVVADLDNRRIRSIDLRTGIVSTIAGNGKKGVPEDGADAKSSPLVDPRAAAVDGRGNVYILERSGNALRVVDRAGKIRTVAGTGEEGNSGDGGDARRAKLKSPKHLCVDKRGNVLIADSDNHRIRMYRPDDGKIVNVTGTGRAGSAGLGGPPSKAELNQPHGVSIGPGGVIYIADSSNHRILKIAATSD